MAEDYRTTAQRLSDGQERLANRISQQRTTDEGGIGLLTTFLGPARYGASTAIRSFDDIRNLLGVLSTANKTNPVRKLIANELAAAEAAKRLAQPTLANAAKRTAALVPVAGAMQAGGGEGPQSVSSIRNIAIEPRVYGAIPGRPGTEVYAGVDAPPIPTPSPDAALKLGLIGGEAVAQDRNQGNLLSGLLGDIDYKGILNQLVKTFQRPEMLTPGVNALTAFGMSGAALNQAEMAGAAAEQERMDKIMLEQLKKSGPMEFKGPMIKSIEKASATKQSLDSINRYLELLSNKKIGGVGAKLEEGVSAIGALFGAGGESGAAAADSIRSQIITGLQIGVAEGQISQGDYDQLNKILAGSGWFVSNPKVESQLQRLKGVLAGKLRTTTKILEAQGIDPSRFSPDAPSGLISARRPAQ